MPSSGVAAQMVMASPMEAILMVSALSPLPTAPILVLRAADFETIELIIVVPATGAGKTGKGTKCGHLKQICWPKLKL